MAGPPDWDQLLQQSEDLAARVSDRSAHVCLCRTRVLPTVYLKQPTLSTCQDSNTLLINGLSIEGTHHVMQDTQGFPRVERDLLQVEQYSQQLKARAARIDPAGDALAATRLLAQEGLNTRKCGLLS